MLRPRGARRPPVFPFGDTSTRYYYLGRNAVHALATEWRLGGEEVLFPSYCHGVELEALIAAGVQPKYYPVRSGMRVDVESIASRISGRTRAVYLIHYLGFPGAVEEVQELCRKRGILLIEDCALALLSCKGSRPLGSFGDAAIFCLYKTLPLPHGGALYYPTESSATSSRTRSPSIASTVAYSLSSLSRYFKAHGSENVVKMIDKLRSTGVAKRESIGVRAVASPHFDPADADLGMSALCGWIIRSLDMQAIVARRRENYARLRDRLQEVSLPIFPNLPQGTCPLFYPLCVSNKEEILPMLAARNIEPVNFWSNQPTSIPAGMFPETDDLRKTIVELPCHQDLTLRDMDRIADQVCEITRGAVAA
ncbi:MAG TPA: DegT/DnrJ/EryC1/StrS family aminotransferase [Clostridia bacterium]|nr:DegT/DnrJ/EryC1/StrS family aminotransferase [Clostridia bacterium]